MADVWREAVTTTYPLTWPDGWPRTPERSRKQYSPFKVNSDKARRELLDELRKMGARHIVVSSNVPVRQDGMPYADAARRVIADPGVAVYFALKDKPLVMARDLYWRVEDNLRSIGLGVAAIRAVERHGGSYMMERAFSGFTALPAPRSCWEILGISPGASEATIRTAWRSKAAEAHPDVGGSTDAMATLNRARDEALQSLL
jgi:hypothetical protein